MPASAPGSTTPNRPSDRGFSSLGHGVGAFPVAERAAGELLSLPLYPHITDEQQVRVVETLVAALG